MKIKSEAFFMTNEEKLEFIKANYKTTRALELLPEEKEEFLQEWISMLLGIIPQRLYKYRKCNNNNLNALKNKKAWFSNPNTWNDQIDVTVAYDIQKDIEYLDEHFDEYVLKFAFVFINQYIESFCEQKKFVTPDKVKEVYYASFKGEDDFNPERMITYLEPIVGWKPARQITVKTQEALVKTMSKEFKEQIISGFEKFLGFNNLRDKLLMYSLSETYNNNHQWAMYADSGAGFCIGYLIKPKNKREASLIPNLLPIYYGERKVLSVSKMLDEALEFSVRPERLEDLINQESENLYVSLVTKSPEWSGEQEWRFSFPTEQSDINLVDFDFAEVVYLGENISAYWKKRILAIAKEQKLKVYQRKMDSLKSRWIYEELNLNS